MVEVSAVAAIGHFANRFANELYSTIKYWTTLLGTNPAEGTKPFKTRYHSEVPGSMRGLYLLIRVSQVRDLYGQLNRPPLPGKFHKNQGVKTLGQPTP